METSETVKFYAHMTCTYSIGGAPEGGDPITTLDWRRRWGYGDSGSVEETIRIQREISEEEARRLRSAGWTPEWNTRSCGIEFTGSTVLPDQKKHLTPESTTYKLTHTGVSGSPEDVCVECDGVWVRRLSDVSIMCELMKEAIKRAQEEK